MFRNRVGPAAAVLVASVAVAGCGGGSTSGASTPSASASGSYAPLTKGTFSKAVTAATSAQKTAHMTLRVGDLLRASADVDLVTSQADLRTRLAAGGSHLTMRARVVDGVYYVSITGLTPPGKFVRLDKDSSQLSDLTSSFGASDPSSVTAAFSEGVTALEYVGPARIDGVTAYHYRVTVDTARAVKALGVDTVTGADDKNVPRTVTEQVFLNADNTLRRGVVAVAGQQGRVDFTGWGDPVTVTAPPKSDVVAAKR